MLCAPNVANFTVTAQLTLAVRMVPLSIVQSFVTLFLRISCLLACFRVAFGAVAAEMTVGGVRLQGRPCVTWGLTANLQHLSSICCQFKALYILASKFQIFLSSTFVPLPVLLASYLHVTFFFPFLLLLYCYLPVTSHFLCISSF